MGTVADQLWLSCLGQSDGIAMTRASPPRTFLFFFFGVGAACNTLNPSTGPQDVRKDIRTVRELMGHKTIKPTMRYSHLAEAHKKAAVEKMNSA